MSNESITIDRARGIILEAASCIGRRQSVSLQDAPGRVCCEPLRAACPLPNYTNSAMDGYALRSAELGTGPVTLRIAGHSYAGAPSSKTEFGAHECVEIATGAAVPEAFDTVIPYEKCAVDEAAGSVAFDSSAVRAGDNIRRIGEQIAEGEEIIPAGTLLTPRHIALAAAAGISEVPVYERVKAAVIATGSELVDPGKPLGPFQIYNSNAVMLKGVLEKAGCEVTVCSALDEVQTIAQRLAELSETNDIVLLSGGAGNGRYDISQAQLAELGRMQSWSINMRPGRPMRFGAIKDRPVFVLPGNPVAAFVTCVEFALPAIAKMRGIKEPQTQAAGSGILACDIRKKPGRAEFMRARIVGTREGFPLVEPVQSQSSADLLMLAQADVILCLDHEPDRYAAGSSVRIQSLAEIGL